VAAKWGTDLLLCTPNWTQVHPIRFSNAAAWVQMDTPTDVAARVRFGRYRGLKSWRSSGWDPKESLPPEYARVFAFENMKRAHRRWGRAR
jgi:40S ribosome biogenesis protein Tsr1 and BMS1 C-terminal